MTHPSQVDHDHSHEHHDSSRHHHRGHHHRSVSEENVRSLWTVFAMTAGFMVVEAVGGFFTNSLALLGDAAHMLTDLAALGLSLFAFWMSSRPATQKKTYGYHRFEILAAFVNGIFLVLLSLAIIWQAYLRFLTPEPVKALEMLIIATLGLVVNLVGASLLMRKAHDNLNMRAALFHVTGDALGSVGAITAALLIYFYGWMKADPLISCVIAGIIIISAFKLILDTTHVILEGVPHHLDTRLILETVRGFDEVTDVHDLHVWSITSGMVALSVHVVARENPDCFHHDLLVKIRHALKERFNIDHVTIQIEDKSLQQSEPHI